MTDKVSGPVSRQQIIWQRAQRLSFKWKTHIGPDWSARKRNEVAKGIQMIFERYGLPEESED